jgi:hypothetical protein
MFGKKRITSRSNYYICFYLFILPNISQSFHRSEFGDAVFSTCVRAFLYVSIIYLLNTGMNIIKNTKIKGSSNSQRIYTTTNI